MEVIQEVRMEVIQEVRMEVIQEVRWTIACKGLAFAAQKHYHQCLEYGWDLEHEVLGCLVCRVVDGMMRYCKIGLSQIRPVPHGCDTL